MDTLTSGTNVCKMCRTYFVCNKTGFYNYSNTDTDDHKLQVYGHKNAHLLVSRNTVLLERN